jgi:hypothetical protein
VVVGGLDVPFSGRCLDGAQDRKVDCVDIHDLLAIHTVKSNTRTSASISILSTSSPLAGANPHGG